MQKNWFETWFHSPYYEMLYYKRDRKEAQEFIDALLNFLQPASQSSFLDLACGSGRHSQYLASKGYEVTGIDLSDELIEKARQHEYRNLSFFVHDMRNEFRINYYNYTLNLFTSFGYFESVHDNERVLKNVYKGLKPGGVFVLDFFHAEKVIQTMVRHESKKINAAEFTITREEEDGFIVKKIHIEDGGKTFDFAEQVRAFTPDELQQLFLSAGFSIKAQFGSYDLQNFSKDSDRLIFIAEK